MVFKRRTPKTILATIAEVFYPRGGWGRAVRYVGHRLRRLPDPAHKISRGIAAGIFVTFTPFYGFHFVLAAVIAFILRGNILASLLATFAGNPLTFPFIAGVSVELGTALLGKPHLPLHYVVNAFSDASVEVWANLKAVFTPAKTEWSQLSGFFENVFMPYLVGGLIPGVVAACVAYALSRPLIASYQMGRIKRLKERFEHKRRAAEAAKEERKAAEAAEVESRHSEADVAGNSH